MITVKIVSTGEVKKVTKNDAHDLIEAGNAVLVTGGGKVFTPAPTFEPQSTEPEQGKTNRVNLRRRGKYLIK